MAKPKAPHHRGDYHVRSRAVRLSAYANPDTRCWRCGRTLAQHPNQRNGRRPHWTAGHVVPGQLGGLLLPEVSSCNYADGARITNARRNPKTRKRVIVRRGW